MEHKLIPNFFGKNPSILKKFLLINFIIFSVIVLLTIFYLMAIEPSLVKKKSSDHIQIIDNTINHIERLTEWYELPYPPNNKNKIKTGNLFYSHKKYNLKVILTAFIIATGTVLFVGIVSHREIKKRMHSSEPESIL